MWTEAGYKLGCVPLEQWIDLNKIRKNLLVNFDFNPMNSY